MIVGHDSCKRECENVLTIPWIFLDQGIDTLLITQHHSKNLCCPPVPPEIECEDTSEKLWFGAFSIHQRDFNLWRIEAHRDTKFLGTEPILLSLSLSLSWHLQNYYTRLQVSAQCRVRTGLFNQQNQFPPVSQESFVCGRSRTRFLDSTIQHYIARRDGDCNYAWERSFWIKWGHDLDNTSLELFGMQSSHHIR